MGSTTSSITKGAHTVDGSNRDVKEIELAIVSSRAEITKTLEALHGRLNPRIIKEELLLQLQEGKDALKADLQAEVHDAKLALGAEYQDIKNQVFTEVKTEVSDAKAALREATLGKVENMVHHTQESVSSAGRSLVSTIKDNPIPAALMGVGLIWMVTSSRSATQSRQSAISSNNGYGDRLPTSRGSGIGNGVGKMARDAASSVSDAAHAAGESLEGAATRVKTSVSDAAHATSRELTHWAQATGSAGERVGQRAGVLFTENPLAVGAAVLVAGALIGMAIPITQKETEWMGDARQDLADRAGKLAHKVGVDLHDGAEQLSHELKKSVDQTTEHNGSSEMIHL